MALYADPVVRFSHIDSVSGESETYAVDTYGHHYLILWFEADTMTEEEARTVAMPITERFPQDEKHIPGAYLEAWVEN